MGNDGTPRCRNTTGATHLYKKRGALVYVDSADRATTDAYADEKRAIGLQAAKLISEGQSVIFDNSTTAPECAKLLDPTKKFTFYSTGIAGAAVLSSYENSILYCSGGYYFPASKGFVGAQTLDFVRSVTADICIIGAGGEDINMGDGTCCRIKGVWSGKEKAGVAVRVNDEKRELTEIYYSPEEKKLIFDATRSGSESGLVREEAPFELREGEQLSLDIFIDRAVIEVYANKKQAICRRVYPTDPKNSTGFA